MLTIILKNIRAERQQGSLLKKNQKVSTSLAIQTENRRKNRDL